MRNDLIIGALGGLLIASFLYIFSTPSSASNRHVQMAFSAATSSDGSMEEVPNTPGFEGIFGATTKKEAVVATTTITRQEPLPGPVAPKHSAFTATASSTPNAPPAPGFPQGSSATSTVSPAPSPAAGLPQESGSSTPAAPLGSPELALALPQLRNALVNIVCLSRDPSLKSISGSGVIIDSRGIILTAAHVAQYFLLTDYPRQGNTTCIIRTGSPAVSAYDAQLVYLSPSWVQKNPNTINAANVVGTGENDFALLAIIGSRTNNSLPQTLPSIPLAEATPSTGDPIVIGSYGAEFESAEEIKSSLYPTLVFSTIKERYTFDTDTVDVLSLGGTAAAQEGSSGGGAVNTQDQLVGLITTSSINKSGDLSARDLHAITPRHIRASFLADTGQNFDTYLKDDFVTLLSSFEDKNAALKKILVGGTVK